MTAYMWAFWSSFCFCRLASFSFSTRVSGTHSSQLQPQRYSQSADSY